MLRNEPHGELLARLFDQDMYQEILEEQAMSPEATRLIQSLATAQEILND